MQKWKKYLSGILTAGMTVGLAAYPVQAAETDSAAPDRFPVLEVPQALQTYEADGSEVQVFGGFTSLTDGEGITRAVDDSRLVYKRGSILSVSSEFDYYKGRMDQVVLDSVTGSDGTSQYLSVLEQDQSIEDYYTRIKWPEELKNSNIVEISSTLDTSDTVLMVRYSDGTVAAFNYVTGKLLFQDESEKKTLSFGEYFNGWFRGTWDHIFDGASDGYTKVKNLESEAKTGAFNGKFASSGSAAENGTHEGGEQYLTKDGDNQSNGDSMEKGTKGDSVNGSGKSDASLKIVGGKVVVSGAVSSNGTGSLSLNEDAAAGNTSLPASGKLTGDAAQTGTPVSGSTGAAGADAVKAAAGEAGAGTTDGGAAGATANTTAADAGTAPAEAGAEAADGGAAGVTVNTTAADTGTAPAEAGQPGIAGTVDTAAEAGVLPTEAGAGTTEAGQPGTDGTDAVQGITVEAGEDADALSLASEETALASAETAQAETATEAGTSEEQTEASEEQESEEQESEEQEAEEQESEATAAALPTAAATGYVTVYNPTTGTYALYDTAEYISNDQDTLMSIAEKKEVLNQGSAESVAQQPEEEKETRSGIAIVITTVVGIGMLLLLL